MYIITISDKGSKTASKITSMEVYDVPYFLDNYEIPRFRSYLEYIRIFKLNDSEFLLKKLRMLDEKLFLNIFDGYLGHPKLVKLLEYKDIEDKYNLVFKKQIHEKYGKLVENNP